MRSPHTQPGGCSQKSDTNAAHILLYPKRVYPKEKCGSLVTRICVPDVGLSKQQAKSSRPCSFIPCSHVYWVASPQRDWMSHLRMERELLPLHWVYAACIFTNCLHSKFHANPRWPECRQQRPETRFVYLCANCKQFPRSTTAIMLASGHKMLWARVLNWNKFIGIRQHSWLFAMAIFFRCALTPLVVFVRFSAGVCWAYASFLSISAMCGEKIDPCERRNTNAFTVYMYESGTGFYLCISPNRYCVLRHQTNGIAAWIRCFVFVASLKLYLQSVSLWYQHVLLFCQLSDPTPAQITDASSATNPEKTHPFIECTIGTF